MASEALADRPSAATRIVEAFEEWCRRMENNSERYAVIAHISGFAVDAVARTVLRDHNLSTLEDYHGLCLRIYEAERKATGC